MKALGEQGSQYAERDWFRLIGLYYLHTRISRRATPLKRNITRQATSCRCFITLAMALVPWKKKCNDLGQALWTLEITANSSICEPLEKPGQPSLKILVADDQVAILESMDKLLSSRGHSVRTFVGCSTGTVLKIIETAAPVKFDVAILDFVLPGTAGCTIHDGQT